MVAAPEISCFGERRADYSALAGALTGPEPTTCHNASTYAIMLGGSVMGLRVWDGMRAVDYLATRPERTTRAPMNESSAAAPTAHSAR